jgi:hypothetical protein
LTLIKRTSFKGCNKGKDLQKTCEALKKVADISSNGFGDTRVLMVKPGKQQTLDSCSTNANVGILVAAKNGATVTVGSTKTPGASQSVALKAGEPLAVDFCREASIEAAEKVPVLFAQAWHPEFSAVERTTELRARAKTFGLGDDEVKAATKIVNDNAKKTWEKTASLWRTAEAHTVFTEYFDKEEAARREAASAADEAARKAAEAGDEERQKNLAELERKRQEKIKKLEAAEEKRLARKKELEDERAKRDPWLNDPTVLEAEKQLEELKEARRDANAKLEFDLSTQLTKEISAAERKLKKIIKKAKKAYKKTGTAPTKGTTEDKADKEGTAGEPSELKALRAKLEDVSKRKSVAAEAENFKEAKKLKAEQKELQEKIKKLEL